MSWTFSDLTPVIAVRLMNPFLDVTYPTEGLAVASFDTGYTGFALVPNSVFQALRMNELRARSVPVTVADGRQVHVKEVFGLLEIPDLELTEQGRIQTHPRVREILVGMGTMRRLVAHVDGCRRILSLEEC